MNIRYDITIACLHRIFDLNDRRFHLDLPAAGVNYSTWISLSFYFISNFKSIMFYGVLCFIEFQTAKWEFKLFLPIWNFVHVVFCFQNVDVWDRSLISRELKIDLFTLETDVAGERGLKRFNTFELS